MTSVGHRTAPTALKALLLTATVFALTGAKCITVPEDRVIAVNVDDVRGTYSIAPGSDVLAGPNACVTKEPSEYLRTSYGQVVDGRLVDVRLKVSGDFAGDIVGGEATVNDVLLLSYEGPWSAFLDEHSILEDDSPVDSDVSGVFELMRRIQTGQSLTLCVAGALSSTTTAELSVRITVFAQLDVDPR